MFIPEKIYTITQASKRRALGALATIGAASAVAMFAFSYSSAEELDAFSARTEQTQCITEQHKTVGQCPLASDYKYRMLFGALDLTLAVISGSAAASNFKQARALQRSAEQYNASAGEVLDRRPLTYIEHKDWDVIVESLESDGS